MTWRAALAVMLAATASAAPGRAEPMRADYVVSQAGLPVMDIRITFDQGMQRYRLTSVARSRGIGRLFLPREQIAEAEGGLAGREVLPLRYRSEGEWRGTARRTVMEFLGRVPRLAVLEPPDEPDRIPLRPEETHGTVDILSALVLLSRNTAQTGRCDLAGAVFDGRRRLEWTSRTLGRAAAPLPGVEGSALRCALGKPPGRRLPAG